MPKWDADTLTEQQRKWFASLREGLERDTGRTLDTWAETARACPETAHRARLKWMKDVHGLAQNRASLVLSAAFDTGDTDEEADDPLWADPHAHSVFDAIAAAVAGLEGVLTGRRKGYTPFSRRAQFAAARPLKGGGVRLGLALPPDAHPRLSPPGRESWSERLTAVTELATPEDVDAGAAELLRRAWERS